MITALVICGPTASGKSTLALELAQFCNVEIINFDSVQVYKEFNIGSAKPSKEELNLVKHHLIDIVEPNENFTAGDFVRHAQELLGQNKNFILVGGTGFYLKALMEGMHGSPPSDSVVKEKLFEKKSEMGLPFLFNQLQKLDPDAAKKIHPNDEYRVMRALEIIEISGQRASEFQKRHQETKVQVATKHRFHVVGLKPEKEALVQQIQIRTQKMVGAGLIQETQEIICRWGRAPSALGSVGYAQALDFLDKKIKNKVELETEICTKTWQLAKRQITWFKKVPSIKWLNPKDLEYKKQIEKLAVNFKDGKLDKTS